VPKEEEGAEENEQAGEEEKPDEKPEEDQEVGASVPLAGHSLSLLFQHTNACTCL